MMMLASAAATKCPYRQTYHREVAKMLGATDQELDELAVVVAGRKEMKISSNSCSILLNSTFQVLFEHLWKNSIDTKRRVCEIEED